MMTIKQIEKLEASVAEDRVAVATLRAMFARTKLSRHIFQAAEKYLSEQERKLEQAIRDHEPSSDPWKET